MGSVHLRFKRCSFLVTVTPPPLKKEEEFNVGRYPPPPPNIQRFQFSVQNAFYVHLKHCASVT